ITHDDSLIRHTASSQIARHRPRLRHARIAAILTEQQASAPIHHHRPGLRRHLPPPPPPVCPEGSPHAPLQGSPSRVPSALSSPPRATCPTPRNQHGGGAVLL